VSRAIRGQVQADRQENRAPVPVGPEPAPTSDPAADLDQLERLVALTTSLAGAGAPPPKAVSRGAYGLIRQRLAEMKGPTETRSGPTKAAASQTESSLGLTEEASGQTKTGPGRTETASSPTEEALSPTETRFGRTKAGSSPTEETSGPTAIPEGPTVAPHGKGRRARR